MKPRDLISVERTREGAVTASQPSRRRSALRSPIIAEIQALRALAVTLVVIFHLWPNRLTGGYVGVDVFFVISGFLITTHISRQIEDRNFALRDFYARRIRRLLPASCLVLLVSIGLTVMVVPRSMWQQFGAEFLASAFYVQNWLLAGSAVDYLAAENAASPVQHFWTLSVEEQFYLIWPLFLMLSFFGARRRRGAVLLALVLVTVVSLTFSVSYTSSNSAAAYFITPARVWEFASGGCLAAFLSWRAPWPKGAACLSRFSGISGISGVALVLAAAVVYSGETAFPGYAALLPVIGTLFVIVSGWGRPSWFRRVSSARPVQLVGNISYSIYLWHWPLIVLCPYVFGGPLDLEQKVVVLGLTGLLAFGTWRYVELPFQRARTWNVVGSKKPFLFAVASTLVIAMTCTMGFVVIRNQVDATSAAVDALRGTPCLGAGATNPDHECPDPFDVTATTDVALAAGDIGVGVAIGPCELGAGTVPLEPCTFGEMKNPTMTIALFGDSHAGQFIEALAPAAELHGWKILTYVKGGCPGIGVVPSNRDCSGWGVNVIDLLKADSSVDAVITSNATSKYVGGMSSMLDEGLVTKDLTSLVDAGMQVIVLRDPPGSVRGDEGTASLNVTECLATTSESEAPCAVKRNDLLTDDTMTRAARDLPSVDFMDLSETFCDDNHCFPVIGGLVVYADGSHFTRSFAATLAPILGDRLVQAFSSR
ncbi:acyltransferase family protein [Cryobacterium sp. Hb1]|uniref:acyltransferase family protein n=1 Tax=Cryobacterium sp. Hb1 TaxID=1259147 RepID=UPI0010690790|nr:acyltransferase family protein [Cryobacterium sp. Hb1]TFD70103.1 acyltransferase [Cryobacterium sp. Hb1]